MAQKVQWEWDQLGVGTATYRNDPKTEGHQVISIYTGHSRGSLQVNRKKHHRQTADSRQEVEEENRK